jgi:hypothetical protein
MEPGCQVTTAVGLIERELAAAVVTRIQVPVWLNTRERSCRRSPINWTHQEPVLYWTLSVKSVSTEVGTWWPPMFERLMYTS